MRALSAAQLVAVWEQGLGQAPVDRAITLLGAGRPEETRESLAALTIARRDADLLQLRELTLGPALTGQAECPRCGARLEFAADCEALRRSGAMSEDTARELAVGNVLVRFRAPTSADLATAAPCQDARAGGRLIAQRCIIAATENGAALDIEGLPDVIFAQLAARLAEEDPGAELLLDLTCGPCGHRWQPLLDVGAFLWAEIDALARRLLREVHVLARAYGWRETDIMAMSAARRRLYLDLLAG